MSFLSRHSATLVGWMTFAGCTFLGWTLLQAQADLRQEDEHRAQLEAHGQDVLYRIAVKRQVVEEVIAGRLSLPEAAAWFRELNGAYSAPLDVLRRQHPGLSDDEIACRNVIDFVDAHLERRPLEAGVVRARLEAELAAWQSDLPQMTRTNP